MAAALAVLVGLALFAADGVILFTRPLWVDEMHTRLLAERASPVDVMRDLAAGADYGPPLIPLAAWALRHLTGSFAPSLVRATSLACVFVALLLVYAVLRRSFKPMPAAVGVLAIGTSELVVTHSFEARFYGPWLLCIAFFAWSLGATSGRWSRTRLAIAAVALCTVHWYGVISMSLMVAAAIAVSGRGWLPLTKRLAPAAAGVLAVAVSMPLAFGQKSALTVSTWVPDFTPSQLWSLLSAFWETRVPLAGLIAIAVGWTIRTVRLERGWARAHFSAIDPSVASLAGLAALPVVLAGLSAAGQPSMLARYCLPAVLAWGVLLAAGAASATRWPATMIALWLAWLWLPGYSREARRQRAFQLGVQQAVTSARQAIAEEGRAVFQSMHLLYAVAGTDSVDRRALAFLELPQSTIDGLFSPGAQFYQLNKGVRVERDVVRVHARRLGFPAIAPLADLSARERFTIVGGNDGIPRGISGMEHYAKVLFPDHCVTVKPPMAFIFVRRGVAKC